MAELAALETTAAGLLLEVLEVLEVLVTPPVAVQRAIARRRLSDTRTRPPVQVQHPPQHLRDGCPPMCLPCRVAPLASKASGWASRAAADARRTRGYWQVSPRRALAISGQGLELRPMHDDRS